MSDATPPASEPAATPYSSAPQQKTNTLAIVALILGILVPIAGIVVGHISLSQIKKTGENGRGLALAGTILGYVGTVLWLIFWFTLIVLPFLLVGTAATFGGY
jgi:peptidyl-prolyl cis-trans isomerase B (cyclophilin B)